MPVPVGYIIGNTEGVELVGSLPVSGTAVHYSVVGPGRPRRRRRTSAAAAKTRRNLRLP